MALTLEESTPISAPPEDLWRRIAEPGGWSAWWPALRHVRNVDRKPLVDGSRLEITLRIRFLTFTLRPTVEVARPPRTLILRARAFGVSARHAFDVGARAGGAHVRQRVTLDGPGLPLFRLLGFGAATRALFAESLKRLRLLLERGR